MVMRIRFDDRVAVITGAGSGLGRSYALHLAARGARVVVNDKGGTVKGTGASEAPAQSVVNEILRDGGKATANFDDVSQKEGASNLVKQTLDEFGKVDTLIRCVMKNRS